MLYGHPDVVSKTGSLTLEVGLRVSEGVLEVQWTCKAATRPSMGLIRMSCDCWMRGLKRKELLERVEIPTRRTSLDFVARDLQKKKGVRIWAGVTFRAIESRRDQDSLESGVVNAEVGLGDLFPRNRESVHRDSGFPSTCVILTRA